ncbi:MAG: DUF3052 domain-containing protein, partial [Bifidobacteriaceae bacterium]|nr:DUF3052 domain-containing protein [Bifidobacteriaceae bacterium]
IQELGYDDDVDQDLRDALEDLTGEALVDEDYGDVVDGIIIWWRDDDGDVTDTLVDALATIEDGGLIWVFTPKPNRPGYVEPADVTEAASTAGMHATSSVSVGPDWAGMRLVQRGRAKK